MTKWYNSIRTYIIVSTLLVIVLFSSFSYFFIYSSAKEAIKQQLRERLMDVVGIVAAELEGAEAEEIVMLKPGDETSDTYLRIAEHLHKLRNNSPELVYFYPIKKIGNQLVFTIDDESYNDQSNPLFSRLDLPVEDPDPKMYEGFEKITASDEFYTDEWGTFLSGYAPLRDRNGTVVAIIGADIRAQTVIQKQNFIKNTIFITIGFISLLIFLMFLYFSNTTLKNINALKDATKQISLGNMNVKLQIGGNNELQEFSESVQSLSKSLIEKEISLKKKIDDLETLNSLTADSEIYAEKMRVEKEEYAKTVRKEIAEIKKELIELKKKETK